MRQVQRFLVASAIVVFLSIGGCNKASIPPKGDKADGPTAAGNSGGAPAADSTSAEKVTAADFVNDKRKYKGKVVEITGKVKSVSFKKGAGYVISLEGKPDSFSEVDCGPEDQKGFWKQVLPSQNVTLRGTVPSEISLGADIQNCTILKAEGPRCPEMTAEEVCKEIDADVEKAAKKYDETIKGPCLISGKFHKIFIDENKNQKALFQTSGKGEVTAELVGFSATSMEDRINAMKPGDALIAIGRPNFTYSPNRVTIMSAVLLPAP